MTNQSEIRNPKSEISSALAVIPARFASTRFPGKPLADKTGKPLIRHVVERVRLARRVGRIIVATDDQRIFDAVRSFGCDAMMTRADHPNGTCRIAEVVQRIQGSDDGATLSGRPRGGASAYPSPDIILNVQGDEPEIEPAVIDALVEGLAADESAPMATIASPFTEGEDPADPNVVKVVVDQRGRALYFSRSPIPFHRDDPTHPPTHQPTSSLHLKHVGIYAYRPDFLLAYAKLPVTPLEQAEKLEQLRALEHGHAIAVVQTIARHHGIDTPQQYEAFVARYQNTQSSDADEPR
jgi:3-deoxy-manno-octulosonate cytidylyltransferase (CMP-KDO synthetase)